MFKHIYGFEIDVCDKKLEISYDRESVYDKYDVIVP